MFTFKIYDDCDVSGRSREKIDQDLKKEFHYSIHCEGLEEMNNKVFVWVDRNIIQFFRTSDEISEAERGRVIAAISLTNPKDTGFDLLFFAEHIKKGSLIPENNESTTNYLNRAEEIFNGFPFFREKNKKRNKKEYNNPDRLFMRLCLLEFLLAVDTHDEIFAVYPGFDELRKKLRESKVYLLLCAKLRYCMYHYKGRNALNSEEYTFVVSKYADLLMDSDFNKFVPPTYYDIPRFFNNPEKELKDLERNSDYWRVDENVREKISKFFMTKHAVFESNTSKISLVFQIVSIALMTLGVIWAIIACIWFDRDWGIVNVFFEYGVLLWFVTAIFLIGTARFIIIVCNVFGQARFRKAQLYHPKLLYLRVIVAMLMGWFTIAISEDLIKSQLDLKTNMLILALVVVLLVVVGILWGEVKQHSPYYCRVRLKWPPRINNAPKIFVIIFPAMFWNLFLGIIMQRVTYDRLLEASGIVHSFSQEQLEDVDHYRQSITTCIDILDEYDHAMDGILHDQGKVDMTVNLRKVDSSSTTTSARALSQRPEGNMEKARQIHNGYLNLIKKWTKFRYFDEGDKTGVTWLASQKDNSKWMVKDYQKALEMTKINDTFMATPVDIDKMVDTTWGSWTDPVFDELEDWCKRESFANCWNEEFIGQKLDSARNIKNDLRVILMQVNRFEQWLKDPERMEKLGIYYKESNNAIDTIPTSNLYLAYIGSNVEHVHWRRKMDWHLSCAKPIMLYPRMLIFHCLIVLVFAFVCQLIISDKSVTEPL